MLNALEQQYLLGLQALLPPGPAWNQSYETYDEYGVEVVPRSNLTLLLGGLAKEFARVHERCLQLVDESNPLKSFETIYARYQEAGLPDPCSGPAETIEQMRAEILARWVAVGSGGFNLPFINTVLNNAGFTHTITEHLTPLAMGRPINQPVASVELVNTINITVTGINDRWFRVQTSSTGERFRTWQVSNIAFCLLNRVKPAHLRLVFTFP